MPHSLAGRALDETLLKANGYESFPRLVWMLYICWQQTQRQEWTLCAEGFEIRRFSGRVTGREVEKMVWIMVALVLALCASFMMCVLTLGKRADQGKERLFRADLQDLQEADASSPLPRRMRAASCKWSSLHPQQNPL